MPTDGQPDVEAIAMELRLVLNRFSRRLRQEAVLDRAEISMSQLSALAVIANRGPLSITELASCERVRHATVWRAVDALATEGLVTRKVDESDRRAALVEVTDSGREVLERVQAHKAEFLIERLQTLPARERARVAAALPALVRLTEDVEQPPDPT